VKLRSYQTEVIQTIKDTFKDHQRQFIEMPTGSGKTITFLSYASQNHKSIMIIVPSKELLNQVYESSLLFYHKSEISRKGNNFNETPSKLHICIINSIRGDYLEFISNHNFDLVVIDEAHHSQSESYQRIIKRMKFNPKFLGVTATPDRSDGLLLKNILDVCPVKLNVLDLINDGFLSDIEGYSVKTKIDISDIDSHNGDFNINLLYKRLCTESRNNMIVELCKKEMRDRKVLIFCINIKHSQEINKLLNDQGISSHHIDGSCNVILRKSILDSFKSGETQVLTNCQLLTEGFDEPSIDGIIISRPTKSRSLFNQMIGRGLRISPGKKNCKIIDIVDNHKSLMGFNEIISEFRCPQINSFKSINDIPKHIGNEQWKVTEFHIERSNLLLKNDFEDLSPTPSMYEYLNENNILHFSPSFDEASFMIWFNEKMKEFLKWQQ
jgi:superfamily II DNA or RNA helicase